MSRMVIIAEKYYTLNDSMSIRFAKNRVKNHQFTIQYITYRNADIIIYVTAWKKCASKKSS